MNCNNLRGKRGRGNERGTPNNLRDFKIICDQIIAKIREFYKSMQFNRLFQVRNAINF